MKWEEQCQSFHSNFTLETVLLSTWKCLQKNKLLFTKLWYQTNTVINNPVKIVFFFFFKLWKRIPLQYTVTGQLSIQVDATGHAKQLFFWIKISRESVSCYLNQPIRKTEDITPQNEQCGITSIKYSQSKPSTPLNDEQIPSNTGNFFKREAYFSSQTEILEVRTPMSSS